MQMTNDVMCDVNFTGTGENLNEMSFIESLDALNA